MNNKVITVTSFFGKPLQLKPDNKTVLSGILILLVGYWILVYFIPDILFSLFQTWVGNAMICIGLIMLATVRMSYALVAGIVCILLFRLATARRKDEGFDVDEQTEREFLSIQQLIHPHHIFDTQQISATPAEVAEFNLNKTWTWSPEVRARYVEHVKRNPYIQTDPDESVKQAMTVYSDSGMRYILDQIQSPEGRFRIYGKELKPEESDSGVGMFAYISGLLPKPRAQCNASSNTIERVDFLERTITPMDSVPGINGNPCKN
jgi:hypothetical protein